MSASENKATTIRFLDAVQNKHWGVVRSLVTDDLVSWGLPSAQSVMGYPATVRGESRFRGAGAIKWRAVQLGTQVHDDASAGRRRSRRGVHQ